MRMNTIRALALTIASIGLAAGCAHHETAADRSSISETRATTSEVAPMNDTSTASGTTVGPASANAAAHMNESGIGSAAPATGVDDTITPSPDTTSGSTSPSSDMSSGSTDTYSNPPASNDTYSHDTTSGSSTGVDDSSMSSGSSDDTYSGTTSSSSYDEMNKKKKAKKKKPADDSSGTSGTGTDSSGTSGSGGTGGM